MSKETIRFTTKTLSSRVLILLILFTVVTMIGSALPDSEGPGQLNSEPAAVYMLDAGHHHLGDGVKPELLPTDAEDTVYTKIFIPDRIDGNTADITLTTKSVVPTDTAGIGLFYDQVYVSASDSRLYAFEHGDPGLEDIKFSAIGYLPLFAFGVMLMLLFAFLRNIKNKSLAIGSWLLALAVVLFLSNALMLEMIPEAGWGMGLLVFMSMPLIIAAGLLFMEYGKKGRWKYQIIIGRNTNESIT